MHKFKVGDLVRIKRSRTHEDVRVGVGGDFSRYDLYKVGVVAIVETWPVCGCVYVLRKHVPGKTSTPWVFGGMRVKESDLEKITPVRFCK